MRRWVLAASALVALAVAAAVIVTRVTSVREKAVPDPESPSARFFARYVAADGRVVRHDEGDDTVSEGQSYALRLALAAGDANRFETVWSWTAEHLQRDDALFSWRWRNGEVVDPSPAADADVDIAIALAQAAGRFGRPEYTHEAQRIAGAVMSQETFVVHDRLFLAAGPWAVPTKTVNPSYLVPCSADELASLTGDRRWDDIGEDSLSLLGEMIGDGLPPDWLVIDEAGNARPVAGPDGRSGSPRYGLDAARIPTRVAMCPDARQVASELRSRLARLDRDGAVIAYSLDGAPVDDRVNPTGIAARAVVEAAFGDTAAGSRLMTDAERLEREHSTYYGSAWVALGQMLLDELAGRTQPLGSLGRSRLGAVAVARQVPTTDPAPTLPPATDPTVAEPTTIPEPTIEVTTPTKPATLPPTTLPPATLPPATTLPPTTPPAAPPPSTSPAPPESTSPEGAVPPAPAPGGPAPGGDPAPGGAPVPGTPPVTAPGAASSAPASGSFGNGDTDVRSDSTPSSAPSAPISTTDQPAISTTATADARRQGDLSSPPPEIDQLVPTRPGAPAVAPVQEAARRRTGAVTVAGFIGVTVLAIALGLRERRTIRRARA